MTASHTGWVKWYKIIIKSGGKSILLNLFYEQIFHRRNWKTKANWANELIIYVLMVVWKYFSQICRTYTWIACCDVTWHNLDWRVSVESWIFFEKRHLVLNISSFRSRASMSASRFVAHFWAVSTGSVHFWAAISNPKRFWVYFNTVWNFFQRLKAILSSKEISERPKISRSVQSNFRNSKNI